MQSFNLRLLKQLLTASSERMIGFKQNTRTDSFTSPKGATLRAVFQTSRENWAVKALPKPTKVNSKSAHITTFTGLVDITYYTYPPQTQPLRSNIHNGWRKQLRLPLQSNASFPLSGKPKTHCWIGRAHWWLRCWKIVRFSPLALVIIYWRLLNPTAIVRSARY